MASSNTLSFSSVVAINHPRPRSTPSQSSMPTPSSSIVGQAPASLSSPSPPLRFLCASSHLNNGATCCRSFGFPRSGLNSTNLSISAAMKPEPLKIMISGAPASGKGTQCELIKKKYGLVHIAAGDLLRAEVAAGTVNGKIAKEYMEKGMLVPDEIVVVMVKERLLQPDAQENGWLLDGYPRSLSQAKALEDLGIRPDLFILLDVKLRLKTHRQNVESVLSLYDDITVKVNADLSKEEVFREIDRHLSFLLEMKPRTDSTSMPAGMAH